MITVFPSHITVLLFPPAFFLASFLFHSPPASIVLSTRTLIAFFFSFCILFVASAMRSPHVCLSVALYSCLSACYTSLCLPSVFLSAVRSPVSVASVCRRLVLWLLSAARLFLWLLSAARLFLWLLSAGRLFLRLLSEARRLFLWFLSAARLFLWLLFICLSTVFGSVCLSAFLCGCLSNCGLLICRDCLSVWLSVSLFSVWISVYLAFLSVCCPFVSLSPVNLCAAVCLFPACCFKSRPSCLLLCGCLFNCGLSICRGPVCVAVYFFAAYYSMWISVYPFSVCFPYVSLPPVILSHACLSLSFFLHSVSLPLLCLP